MKKYLLYLLAFLSTAVSYAQQSNLLKANDALKRKAWSEAISAIEEACSNSETKDNAATWYMAAHVYSSIMHKTKEFSAKYAEKTEACIQKCRMLGGVTDMEFGTIYFYAGEAYYRKCEAFLDEHDFKSALVCATRAAEFFLAGDRPLNAAEANNLLAVCKLGYARGESNMERKCAFLQEAAKYLETSTELYNNSTVVMNDEALYYGQNWKNYEVIKTNNDYLFNYAGEELMKAAGQFYDAGDYKMAMDCAHGAQICFFNSENTDMEDNALQMIGKCEDAVGGASPTGNNLNPTQEPMQTQTPLSDVDENIPVGKEKNTNTYVYIIANEDYPNRRVPYALNDGRSFMKYCYNTLGIPLNHIRIYENATAGNIIACVTSVRKASEANDGDINVLFYYAGHAFPDEETKDAYLMPVDGDSWLIETCYSLKRLYKELGGIKTRQVVCFLDACFSGTTREDDMLRSGRGVAIKPKEETPQGNLIVFTSASGAETAHQYEAKMHGLFTYFLLKKIQESKGATTLGDLYDYVSRNVKRTSYDENEKIQTPSVMPSASMTQKWRNIKM